MDPKGQQMAIIALSEQPRQPGRQSLEQPGKMEIKEEFVQLRAKGWSYTRIARKLKVSKSTLSNWRGELEEEIASLKAMELEALQERYWMAKEGKIKLLGETLKAIQKEIKDRDKALADVPTEKLLELQCYGPSCLAAKLLAIRASLHIVCHSIPSSLLSGATRGA